MNIFNSCLVLIVAYLRDWQIERNGIHRLLGATGFNVDFEMLEMVAIFLFGICNSNEVIINQGTILFHNDKELLWKRHP